MKYYVQTFGCKVSQYETQSVREAWLNDINGKFSDISEVSKPDEADVLIIASCAVTREGVTDARQLCNKWRKNFPSSHIIVTGCAAEVARDDFKNANAVITQKARHIMLENHPLEINGYYAPEKKLDYPPFEITNFKRSRPIVKVQDGCSHVCSYCIVPFTRGPSRSRPLESIINEVGTLLENGYRELVISGINLRQYDFDNLDFWDVLNALQEKYAPKWEKKARFRLSSLEPAQLNQKGIECLTRSEMIAPHLHLSLQSGSQTVLKRMNREHYELKEVHDSLDSLKQKWGLFGLGADFLLGFPEESENEFQETLSFINELPFSYAHVFPYSIRPNTRAGLAKGQLEKHVKQERTAQVRSLIEEKQKLFLKESCRQENLMISFDVSANPKEYIEGLDQYYNSCVAPYQAVNHELVPAKALNIQGQKIKISVSDSWGKEKTTLLKK